MRRRKSSRTENPVPAWLSTFTSSAALTVAMLPANALDSVCNQIDISTATMSWFAFCACGIPRTCASCSRVSPANPHCSAHCARFNTAIEQGRRARYLKCLLGFTCNNEFPDLYKGETFNNRTRACNCSAHVVDFPTFTAGTRQFALVFRCLKIPCRCHGHKCHHCHVSPRELHAHVSYLAPDSFIVHRTCS
ncbi:hypothetical protein EXIGLDRAFT_423935 [Exidia glandulosa HHB12029]|uniref:Uncharacterized protein n=1 Tax=Exidia glandulosa HHB12029 TaxID=1314781 RepID=A0A165KK23_EXIGL|nr:hypothetical protein EXIGLDRAFT_423935 [Exidia glandulosa HHB12029]